jgi:hypothetical protein
MINKAAISGKYDIYINGKFMGTIKNRIMDTVLEQLVACYKGNAADVEIKYLALGTDSTAVTDSDTTLGAEIFRTPISTQTDVDTGEILTEFIVLDTEAVAQIEEIGIFGGATANASADTGTLISRILWSKNKTNSEEITFRRTDIIERG